MSNEMADLVRVVAAVRRCFWLLAATSDDMIADLELTASLRAVLEFLDQHGPQTVPQIARAKSVKRQSIQALVDQLRDAGFVRVAPNPAHQRSVLVVLAPKGKTVFAEVQRRERSALRRLLRQLGDQDLITTAATLEALKTSLQTLEDGEESNVA